MPPVYASMSAACSTASRSFSASYSVARRVSARSASRKTSRSRQRSLSGSVRWRPYVSSERRADGFAKWCAMPGRCGAWTYDSSRSWSNAARRLVEVGHAGDHVDHRFGGEAGDGGRADVVDAAFEPRREHPLQQRALGVETPRPVRVVRDDRDRLVRHRASSSTRRSPRRRRRRRAGAPTRAGATGRPTGGTRPRRP